MKKIFVLFISCLQVLDTFAALKNGDDAPDFSVVDINGATVSLYSRMGANRSACLDFFATWCSPCWSFHQSGVLHQVHDNLSAETVVLMLESDFNTNTDCLYGLSSCVGGTRGNWVAGTHFPIIDLSNTNGPSVKSDYNVTAYPTLYVISPDKRVWNIVARTYANYHNWITKSFKLAATAAITHSTCGDNGRIVLNTTGGLGSLTYEWSNGATTKDLNNIPGGTYKVTITDQNGYFKEFGPYVVNGPSRRVAIVDQSIEHVKCWGNATGEINITVDYGTPGYRYAWSSGQNVASIRDLRAGAYTVTVTDANNCTTTKSYTINEPAELKLKARVTTDECEKGNGTIIADAKGGVFPYAFDIGQGQQNSVFFSDLRGGIYRLVVTDANNCEKVLSVEVPKTIPPKAEAGQSMAISCINDTLLLDGGGSSYGPNYDYIWTTKNGRIIKNPDQLTIEVDMPGLYKLKITDIVNGCIAEDSVLITDDRKFPDIEATGDGEINCRLTEKLLRGRTSSLPVRYYWTKVGETFLDTSSVITVSTGGNYIFNVKDTVNLCIARDTVTIREDKQGPQISVVAPADLNCRDIERIIDASQSETGMTIRWETNHGNIVSGENTLLPVVNKPAVYRLYLTNEVNGCTSTFDVEVRQDIEKPVSDPGPAKELSCLVTEVELDGSQSSKGNHFAYLWTTTNGHILRGENTLNPVVVKRGDYTLSVTNLINHCVSVSETKILEQEKPEAKFDYSSNNLKVNFRDQSRGLPKSFEWSFGDGHKSTEQSPTHVYQTPGEYRATCTVTNDCGSSETHRTIFFDKSSGGLSLFSWELQHVSCFGGSDGSILLEVGDGVPPYTYEWSSGGSTRNYLDQLVKGNYEVLIRDSVGNEIRKTFVIREPAQIEVEDAVIKHATTGQSDGSIHLKITGGVPQYSYLWSNGATSSRIDNLPAGNYSCVVTDQNGCVANFGPYEVKEVVSTINLSNKVVCQLVPNPVRHEGVLQIHFSEITPFQLVVTNAIGQTLYQINDKAKDYRLPIHRQMLDPGIYFIVVNFGAGSVTTKCLIE